MSLNSQFWTTVKKVWFEKCNTVKLTLLKKYSGMYLRFYSEWTIISQKWEKIVRQIDGNLQAVIIKK